MKFLKKLKKSETGDFASLVRSKSKTRLRWLWLTLIALILLMTWYFIGLYRAYQLATVKNSNSTSQSVLKDALNNAKSPVNILIIGIEGPNYPGGLLSDSMMIASVDTKAKSVSLLSLPRDLYVTIPGYGKDKINAVHSLAEQAAAKTNQKGQGPALLRQVIVDTFDIPIHYFVRMDFDGFRKIIDAIDGVDINVKSAIHDPFYPNGTGGYATFSLKAGPQHMNGEVALKYARSRQTTSDFDRARRQQDIVSAAKDKLLSPSIIANPKKTTDLITIIGGHILTDFSLSELNQVVAIAKEMPNPKVYTKVLDTSSELGLLKSSTSSAGAYIIVPSGASGSYNQVSTFVQGFFAKPRISAENTTIELVNGGAKDQAVLQLKKQLEFAGFTVVISESTQTTTQTSLLDYKKSTPNSISYLETRYGLSTLQATAPADTTSHIVLVLGNDWSQIEKESADIAVDSTTPAIISQ